MIHLQLLKYASLDDLSIEPPLSNEDKGYICKEVTYFFYGLLLLTSGVTVVVIFWLIKTMFYKINVTKYSLCYSLGCVSLAVNIVDIVFIGRVVDIQVTALSNISTDGSVIEKYAITNVIRLVIGILIFLIGGGIGAYFSKSLPSLPHIIPCCVCVPKSVKIFVVFGNCLYFGYTTGLNIPPTVILLLIAPVKTISIVVLSASVISTLVIGNSILLLEEIKMRKTKRINNCCMEMKNSFSGICRVLFLIAIGVLIGVYAYGITLQETPSGDRSNIIQVILSLVSPLLPVQLGRKLYKKWTLIEEQQEDSLASETSNDNSLVKESESEEKDTERNLSMKITIV